MEKIIKKVLTDGGADNEVIKMITMILNFKKSEIQNELNEISSKHKEKSDKRISELNEKIAEEKRFLADTIEKEEEKIIKREVLNNLKALKIEIKPEKKSVEKISKPKPQVSNSIEEIQENSYTENTNSYYGGN